MTTNEKRSFFSTMFTRKTTAKAAGLDSGPSQQDEKTTKSPSRSWFSTTPAKPKEVKVEETPKVVEEPPVEAPPVEPTKLEDEPLEGTETAAEPIETAEDIEAVAERKFIKVLRKIGIPVALAAAACAAVMKFISQ